MLEIALIRHGMTAGNEARRYIGRTDEPLLERERIRLQRDAQAARGRLFQEGHMPQWVLTSPLLRCRQTARGLYPELLARQVPDFRETDFGLFENKAYEELQGDARYRAWIGRQLPAPPDGEGMADFCARCRAAFLREIDRAHTDGICRLCAVVHGGVIMAVMEAFARPSRSFYDWQAAPLTGYRLRSDAQEWRRQRAVRVLGGWSLGEEGEDDSRLDA